MPLLFNKEVRVFPSILKNNQVLEIQGYKHAMVQIFAISIAMSIKVQINNAPLVDDTKIMCDIINDCGGFATISGHRVFIDPTNMFYKELSEDVTSKIHGTLYLISAFAIRFGTLNMFETGGCQIGDKKLMGKRPTSQIIELFELFTNNSSIAKLYNFSKNKNQNFEVDIMSFSDSKVIPTGSRVSGATKIAILYALTTNQTIIKNAYLKTDVFDMLRFIKKIGYNVILSKNTIIISKSQNIKNEIKFNLTSCPSEIMTYITLAVLKNIELSLVVKNITQLKITLKNEFLILKKMGVNIIINKNIIKILHTRYPLNSVNIVVNNDTIQSDHHPFFTLLLLIADKKSKIKESVWKNRFLYAEELKKINADVEINENEIIINPSRIKNKSNQVLICSDTRAGAVLLLASLISDNKVVIKNLYHIERGYENLIENLQFLGAKIEF